MLQIKKQSKCWVFSIKVHICIYLRLYFNKWNGMFNVLWNWVDMAILNLLSGMGYTSY